MRTSRRSRGSPREIIDEADARATRPLPTPQAHAFAPPHMRVSAGILRKGGADPYDPGVVDALVDTDAINTEASLKLTLLRHDLDNGWSEEFPALDSASTLVIVFGAPEYRDDKRALAELKAAFPTSTIVGCSTSGEIFKTKIYDRSLAVAVARFERSQLRHITAPIANVAGSADAGAALAEALNADDLKGVFVLSDGLQVNGSELVRGFASKLPDHVVITGGLAGDGPRFERTWTLSEGELTSDSVTAVGLYGESLSIGHGSRGGWDPFGPRRQVTRSENNVLFELDGRPALDLYKEYLGERADGLPATGLLFPLALLSESEGGQIIVRTILGVDEAQKSLTFAGDVPTGARVQLMKANFDRLIEGAEEAAEAAGENMDAGEENILTIAISCVGRRLVLSERTEEEVEATADILPDRCAQIGFYSYGEISPTSTGPCELHNQTMTLTTIREG